MNHIETNTIKAFQLVKRDIIELRRDIASLQNTNSRLMKKLQEKKVTQTVRGPAKKTIVASKEGKKFHNLHCAFAKNIKPKSKVLFKTKTKALNEGYKPCSCIN